MHTPGVAAQGGQRDAVGLSGEKPPTRFGPSGVEEGLSTTVVEEGLCAADVEERFCTAEEESIDVEEGLCTAESEERL